MTDEPEKLPDDVPDFESHGAEFDIRTVTQWVTTMFKDYKLKGVSFTVVDGNAGYLTAYTGTEPRIHHLVLMAKYTADKIHANWKAGRLVLDYPDELALSDLLNSVMHFQKKYGLEKARFKDEETDIQESL